MPIANKNNGEEHLEKLIGETIDRLFFEDAQAAELGEIRLWLLGEENAELKERILRERFRDIYFRYDTTPDEALASWPALARRLGLNENLCREQCRATTARKKIAPRYKRIGLRVAAVLAPLMIVSAFLVVGTADKGAQNEKLISLSVGPETETIVLPDGSRIEVKPGSTIAYPENFAENRNVALNGEAFFAVAKDEQHPFTVEGGTMKVTVHGTEFSVRAYENDPKSEVMLASGRVSVAIEDRVIAMEPMQRLRIDKADNTTELEEIGEGQLLKLRGCVLNFDGIPLREALALLSDYYDTHIDFVGNADLTDEVVMTFDENTTLEDAMFILQITLPKFTYIIDGDTIIISPK